jgi:hypothetical protein
MGEKGQEKMAKKEKMRRKKMKGLDLQGRWWLWHKVGVYKIIKRILVTVRDCIKKDYDKGAT